MSERSPSPLVNIFPSLEFKRKRWVQIELLSDFRDISGHKIKIKSKILKIIQILHWFLQFWTLNTVLQPVQCFKQGWVTTPLWSCEFKLVKNELIHNKAIHITNLRFIETPITICRVNLQHNYYPSNIKNPPKKEQCAKIN